MRENMLMLRGLFLLILISRWTNAEEQDETDGSPLEVLVEQTTSESVTLSWRRPPHLHPSRFTLYAYSLIFIPLSHYGGGTEKEFSLPPSVTSKRVQGLRQGTRYVVQLAAVYGEAGRTPARHTLRRLAAPKFTVITPPDLQHDTPQVEPPPPPPQPACECSELGMLACVRREGASECACRPGYEGARCESCAPGNFRAGKECALCPCTNVTSTAECTMDVGGQVSCAQCLPGHRGSLCGSCAAGYRRQGERCVPLDCLGPRICADKRDIAGCRDCDFAPPTAQRSSNSGRSVADGTTPLLAVAATLSALLLVASLATCYRAWATRRRAPQTPFWSVELQEDLYRHLDVAKDEPKGTAYQSIDI